MKSLLLAAMFFAAANAQILQKSAAVYDFAAAGTLIDVRTPAEWAAGVIEGAHMISITDSEGNVNSRFVQDVFHVADPAVPLVLICRSGSRSSFAAHLLQKHGYKGKIINLQGGMQAVDAARVKVIRP